jgi:hypothetical protein
MPRLLAKEALERRIDATAAGLEWNLESHFLHFFVGGS